MKRAQYLSVTSDHITHLACIFCNITSHNHNLSDERTRNMLQLQNITPVSGSSKHDK